MEIFIAAIQALYSLSAETSAAKPQEVSKPRDEVL